MSEGEGEGNYEVNEHVAPWQRKTTARLEQKQVTKQMVHCNGCGAEWEPMDGAPKHCKECKAKLEYPDDLEQEPESDAPEEDADAGEGDDLDEFFGGDDE